MMDGMQARIPTHLWVEAEVRRLSSEGLGVYVAARGDKTGGMVIQKVADMNGQCRLMGQQRDLLGKLVWINLLQDDIVEEREADAYIQRALQRDPDLWVVEIEDRSLKAALSV
jgi:hypothetical protein